jgi:hypothetical protein
VVALGAVGLGAALLSAFVIRWEYGVGLVVLLVVLLLLVGGLAPA